MVGNVILGLPLFVFNIIVRISNKPKVWTTLEETNNWAGCGHSQSPISGIKIIFFLFLIFILP